MEQAKAAASKFLSKGGQHDTTIHESVAPSVQNEVIREQNREEQQVVRDREIHQDHYHTTVQPVKDHQVLPEQHHHNQAAVEHRTFDHGNESDIKQRLQAEQGQFKNRTVHESSHHTTTTNAPEIGSDRVHHHIHEVIQPVIHKDTIEPHVVHTTVPIHETHYNAAKHHTSTNLPAVSLAEFQKSGGSITGRDERVHHFEGEPKGHHFDASRDLRTTGGNIGTGAVGMQKHTTLDPAHDQHKRDSGLGSEHSSTAGYNTKHSQNTSTLSSATHGGAVRTDDKYGDTMQKKPSLLDRLNPMKDADGDGKKGFMD